ncbi:MAG: RluA family pseudouridine synthase [Ruminococcaceae bacterium]|nr:RluA family pseudouridine synthase [Oscillospiraceae bacterium]
MDNIKIICDAENIRLDRFLKLEDVSRSQIQKMINEEKVKVNGAFVKTGYLVQIGDEIEVEIPEPKNIDVIAEDIPLDIVYEDSDLIVVNKPQGMVVHPAAGNYTGTLVNALLYHCKGELSGINGAIRPGIVHRIDKDTSGLLVVAKTNKAHLSLAEQIKEKSVTREYVCVVSGLVSQNKGIIDAPIGRHPTERKMMTVTSSNSRNAVTHFEVNERFYNTSYVTCKLETGRTHQIRVHMKYIGHPVLGDPVYGAKRNFYSLKGQALHARTLGFIHPSTNEYMEFSAPLPEYFEVLLTRLREES